MAHLPPGHCLVLSAPPHALHATTGPYHSGLNVRLHKTQTSQRRPTGQLIHLTSVHSSISILLPYMATYRTKTSALGGALSSAHSHAPVTRRPHQGMTPLRGPEHHQQYFLIIPLASHRFMHPMPQQPANPARPQPLPPSILSTATPVLMASHHFLFRRLAEDSSIAPLHAPRHRRPCPQKIISVFNDDWILCIMASIWRELFYTECHCAFAVAFS